jgi:hypothetical protein
LRIPVLIACTVFVLLGTLLIPYLGIQNDEVAFVSSIYFPAPDYSLRIGHHLLPLMIQSYAGTLKTYLYWPLIRNLPPSPWLVRFPMLLAGALTIFLFYEFAATVAGPLAALIAALLLATDATYLLTTTVDWGPVALQHLLMVAGCLAIVRRRPALGAFLFGLAMWDKAVFVWALSGLAAGTVAVCLPQVRRVIPDKNTALRAAAAFLIGASPVLLYNVTRPNATMSSNGHISLADLPQKLYELEFAADGSGLFGYLVSDESSPQPKPPSTLAGRAAGWIRDHTGAHHASVFPYAALLAVLLAPLWWRLPARRAALFSIIFCIVAFAAMALTKGAGGAIHHTVLLWPFPQLLVGIALSAIRPQTASLAAAAVLLVSNLLVTNQYVVQFERNGANASFTDALNPLSAALSDSAHDTIYVIDWGMFDNVSYLHKGRLDLRPSQGPLLSAAPNADQQKEIADMLRNPRALFVGHAAAREEFSGVAEHLRTAAAAAGYEQGPVRTIADSNGRPVFELFRFQPKEISPSRRP